MKTRPSQWHHTPEYFGGLIAGIGMGILLVGYLLFGRNMLHEMGEIAIVGLILASAGAVIASHYHRKKHTNNTGE